MLIKHGCILSFLMTGSLVWGFAQAEMCSEQHTRYDIGQSRLIAPAIAVEGEGLLIDAQFQLTGADPFLSFQLTEATVSEASKEQGSFSFNELTLNIPALCIGDGEQSGTSGYFLEMQAAPGSDPIQFKLKQLNDVQGAAVYQWPLNQQTGDIFISARSVFEKNASTVNASSIFGAQEVKFVLLNVDSAQPVLVLMNTQQTKLHYDFMREQLGYYQEFDYWQGNSRFFSETYFRDDRAMLAGSIIAYDDYVSEQGKGIYAIEFWPTDNVPEQLIELAYRRIQAALPFAADQLAYHPVGDTHEIALQGFAERFAQKHIAVVTTDDIFKNLDSAVLNTGEAYGILKIINPGDRAPGEDVIAIYNYAPNELGHVGGIITIEPQTPLSHINLKAKQNNTPNAYLKDATDKPEINALLNQWVHYQVDDNGVHLSLATEQQALQWLADLIPDNTVTPGSDLTVIHPRPLTDVGFDDWTSIGVKAANVAELGKILTADIPPRGYAIPFYFYDQFMQLSRCFDDMRQLCDTEGSVNLYQYVSELINQELFKNDRDYRADKLTDLRNLIEDAEVTTAIIDELETIRLFWEPSGEPFTQKLRLRSSTNNEDLPGFNGAGLYDSVTHKPKEGQLIKSVKEIWASLWTERAFEERRLHNIDHLKTYMGILVHPNYGDEQVNGVAISKNIYNPGWEGYYINAQYGEISITNPEPIATEHGFETAIPDELIVTHLPNSLNTLSWETLYIRHSNVETVYGAPVSTENTLTESEIEQLRVNMTIIHDHFKSLYQGDDDFAIDIEFKITETFDGSRGRLAIKQARPWVD